MSSNHNPEFVKEYLNIVAMIFQVVREMKEMMNEREKANAKNMEDMETVKVKLTAITQNLDKREAAIVEAETKEYLNTVAMIFQVVREMKEMINEREKANAKNMEDMETVKAKLVAISQNLDKLEAAIEEAEAEAETKTVGV